MNYKEVNTRNAPRLQGEAGVLRVASELLLRGFNPLFPAVDCGADLLVEGGVRIQVKSAHLRYQSAIYPQGAYWFKLTRGPVAQGNHTLRKRTPRIFSDESDFVVFWGIEQHRFWIVPSFLVDGKSLLIVGPDIAWKELDAEQIRQLHSDGHTIQAIADKLGVSWMTIQRRVTGKIGAMRNSTTLTYKVRECENRWDLIQNAVDTMTGVELLQADAVPTAKEV